MRLVAFKKMSVECLIASARRCCNCFAIKELPFCHENFAASTGTTCRTSIISGEAMNNFLGSTMVPNSQMRQALLTIALWKAEQFTLNLRQGYDSMLARVP
jgi:hypothetical protein